MSNTLKVRDDHAPICFEAGDEDKFKLCDGSDASWLSQNQTFGTFMNERCKGKDATKLRFVM